MKQVFLVFGYGVPKDILHDEQYRFYLSVVFNTIYEMVTKQNCADPVILCSGGPTDMFPPYKRTEAEEMIRLLKHFAERPFLKERTAQWTFIPETHALSTLENMLNCQAIMEKEQLQDAQVTIFCEYTRQDRIQTVAKNVLQQHVAIVPIDFDVSENRYLDPAFIAKKEEAELKHSLWALKNPENLKKHHALFQEKIDFLRNAGPDVHGEKIKEWWIQKLRELEEQS